MIVLDTSIVADLLKPQPDGPAKEWLSAQPADSVFITTISQAELLFSVSLLPAGQRQNQLSAAITARLAEDFAGRILPFDIDAAKAFGPIVARLKETGRGIPLFQIQIAAIARSRGAALATKHADSFKGCGVELVEHK